MTAVALDPIVKTVVVRRSAADAFRIFTEQIFEWWPLATHTMAKDALGEKTVTVTIEPRVGGRIFERLNTGTERDWGDVRIFEPARRLVFDFYIGRTREFASEVDVRFEALGAGECRVTLTHAKWDRLGAEAPRARSQFDGGWMKVFEDGFGRFAGR